jgi:hypothetical protein
MESIILAKYQFVQIFCLQNPFIRALAAYNSTGKLVSITPFRN